jgi:predicted GIY-YIG superfamily endonuclease
LMGEGCLPKLRSERRETDAMWYVYFLKLSNDGIYVGSTNDLRRRAKSHRDGRVLSTKSNLPVTLKSYVAVETEALARALERYFKSGSGRAVAKKTLSFRGELASDESRTRATLRPLGPRVAGRRC